jgi:gluconokinase
VTDAPASGERPATASSDSVAATTTGAPTTSGPAHIVVMGVSGSGKSTVGALLSARLGRALLEGDDVHPARNKELMAAGRALTDADRAPWLAAIAAWMDERAAEGRPTVVVCSALRRAYRTVLAGARGSVLFVLLDVPAEDLAARLAARRGHFMPPGLLGSQLATLEPLADDEPGLRVDATGTPSEVVAVILGSVPGL